MSTNSSSGRAEVEPERVQGVEAVVLGLVAPALGHVGVGRSGEEGQHGSAGAGRGSGHLDGPSVERLTVRGHGHRVSPILAGMPHPLTTPIINCDRGLRERDQPAHDLLERRAPLHLGPRADRQRASSPRDGLDRRQAERPRGTDPHRTARPVAAPPGHRPHRQACRGRHAAQPAQPRDHRRQDGRRAQPDARTPATPAACSARRPWARCSRASSAASSSPSSR